MPHAKWFVVTSAEYGQVVLVVDFGVGPVEYSRDVVYVRTRTLSRVKSLAVRALRRRYSGKGFRPDYLSAGENPFRGMEARRVLCGLPTCDHEPDPRTGYCCAAHESADCADPFEGEPRW